MVPKESLSKIPPTSLAQTCVLLVDDQKAARQLLRAFLLRIGVGRVEEATDSIEALRLVMLTPSNQSPYDIVFVSRMMREMTGLDLVLNIRQLAGWSSFPIVVVSEDMDAVHLREAYAEGASEYLLRPFREEQLREILLRHLGL